LSHLSARQAPGRLAQGQLAFAIGLANTLPPDNGAPRELVTRKEIHQRCKVHPQPVKRWDRDKVIKRQIDRGVIRYYWDEVLLALHSRPERRGAK
jgi:hypothetical protein